MARIGNVYWIVDIKAPEATRASGAMLSAVRRKNPDDAEVRGRDRHRLEIDDDVVCDRECFAEDVCDPDSSAIEFSRGRIPGCEFHQPLWRDHPNVWNPSSFEVGHDRRWDQLVEGHAPFDVVQLKDSVHVEVFPTPVAVDH